MAKEVVVTREGYNKLEQELENLRTVKRKEVADKIKVAIAVAAATPPMPRPSAPVSTRSSTMLAAQLINSSSNEDELLPMPRKRPALKL